MGPRSISYDLASNTKKMKIFVAGGIGGAVSRTLTAPIDRIQIFLQVHGTKIPTMRDAFRIMYAEGGYTSFWSGNFINIIKIAPESAIKFTVYEEIRNFLRSEDDSDEKFTNMENFFAGATAGGISQTLVYPLDVMRTRFALKKPGEYHGIANAAQRMYRKGGFRSFWNGCFVNFVGSIPYAGIDLTAYEILKSTFIRTDERASDAILLCCGATSSIIGQVCTYPLALIRTKLQAQVLGSGATGVNFRTTFKTILQEEGFRGLYHGMSANFIRVVPAVSITYMVYERVKRLFGVQRKRHN